MHKIASVYLIAVMLWSCSSAPTPTDTSTPDILTGDKGPDTSEVSDGGDTTTLDVPHIPSTLDFPVDQPGPYNIGYRTFPHSYVVPATGAERLIDIHIWYPTEATDGEHPTYEIFPDDISITDAPLAPPVSYEAGTERVCETLTSVRVAYTKYLSFVVIICSI